MLYSQPQASLSKIDWNEPLTAGLIQAHNGLSVVDATAPSVLPTVMGTPIQRPDGLEFSSSPAGTARLVLPHEKTNSFTVAILVRALGNSSPFASLTGIMYDAAGNAPYGDQFDRDSSGANLRFAFNVGGSAQALSTSAGVSTTDFTWLFATFTSGSQILQVDGVTVASNFFTGTPSYTATSVTGLGNILGDGRNANCIIKFSARWGRVLSQIEMDAVRANPWRIFEDQVGDDDVSYLRAGVASAVTASLAWTEANEGFSISSLLTNRAAGTWTEGNDSVAVSSTVTDRALLSWTEADDSQSISAVVTNRGSLFWSEQGDTMAITATAQEPAQASIQAAMAWTEAGETSAVVARLLNRAAIAQIEQGDVWNLTAYAEIPPIKPTVTVTVRFIAIKRDYNMKTINLTD